MPLGERVALVAQALRVERVALVALGVREVSVGPAARGFRVRAVGRGEPVHWVSWDLLAPASSALQGAPEEPAAWGRAEVLVVLVPAGGQVVPGQAVVWVALVEQVLKALEGP